MRTKIFGDRSVEKFQIEDYLNDDSEIQALLNMVINDGTQETLMECIRAIARLKSIDLNLGDSFDSIQKTLKVVGYKFVVRRSDI
ncbi:hypothetical protein [Pseudomonas coronafaciens]|uniref:hypothetical protein n=1 Tax=Pseudomonas coronafaciens TaxID=53409 RepID=UPI0039A0BDB6